MPLLTPPRAARVSGVLLFLSAAGWAADPPASGIVAAVGNQPIPYSQLQSQIQSQLDQQQRQFDVQLQQLSASFARNRHAFIELELGKLVDAKVLDLEAAARKTTTTALTAALKPETVTDAQVQAFYESHKAQISQPLEQVTPQIKTYLQNESMQKATRRYVDSLRAKYKAAVMLEPMREQVSTSGPGRGPENAPVTIVEFSDFQCPFCGRFMPVLSQVLAAYPKQVRLVYRHFPLTGIHASAQKAAEAGACADKQGKFWEMHDTLFAEQNALAAPALKEKAKRLGLDTKSFDACLDGGQTADVVAADMKAGESLGLEATPASFVNGRFVNGAVSFEQMSALIEDELHRSMPVARR